MKIVVRVNNYSSKPTVGLLQACCKLQARCMVKHEQAGTTDLRNAKGGEFKCMLTATAQVISGNWGFPSFTKRASILRGPNCLIQKGALTFELH